MLRRHFFLVGAVAVLAVMILVAGFKLATAQGGGGQGGPGGPGGPGMAQGKGPGGGGPGGGGGFGGAATVAVVQAQPHNFVDALEVIGVAKGRQSVTLTAAATQLVERVHFSDGQQVPRGAVLVQLKSAEQDAGVAQAQARLVEARRAYERWRQLGEKGFASKASIEQYEAAYRTAEADVAAARAREQDRVIRAPFSGVVGLTDIAPGALVNPGAPIVTLDDLSAVRVDFEIPERYLASLREGQSISATADAYPGETINGVIKQLDTRVDERTRAITARAEFPNAGGRLKPGMMMRVAIARGSRTGLAVPEAAVSMQGNSTFVFVISQQGGRTVAEQRPIVAGVRQNGFVEVRDGLSAGERIVGDGLNRIQPGQAVQIAGAAPAGRPAGAAKPPPKGPPA
ncbi:efflux RND transporter periplasmic adaptor subunit [Phenylobacterium terrae]|uniref:Efflux RND transporter periplasmic adaptor subunit n=1 Tax=Phenylobacterium terrae TaxID=2665495 RepID=A0ABW4N777_9CAUL